MVGEPFPPVVVYAIPAFVALMLIEIVAVRATGRGRYEARDTATSLSMGIGNQAIGLVTRGGIALLFGWVYEHRLFEIGREWWAFVLCFVAEDFAYYWFHRLAHERRWMWAAHVNHHSSRRYNLSTALRQTWTSALALSFIFTLPLAWIGFEPAMIFLASGCSLIYQFWIHTELIDRLGPLEAVLNTPSHHRVHHAANPRYLDANYGGVLIVWDRLFGTFVAEVREEPPRYGLVKDITTYNPLRVAFHEWAAIARDLRGARSLREVLGYTWGRPGWRPDGSGRTSAALRAEWQAQAAAVGSDRRDSS